MDVIVISDSDSASDSSVGSKAALPARDNAGAGTGASARGATVDAAEAALQGLSESKAAEQTMDGLSHSLREDVSSLSSSGATASVAASQPALVTSAAPGQPKEKKDKKDKKDKKAEKERQGKSEKQEKKEKSDKKEKKERKKERADDLEPSQVGHKRRSGAAAPADAASLLPDKLQRRHRDASARMQALLPAPLPPLPFLLRYRSALASGAYGPSAVADGALGSAGAALAPGSGMLIYDPRGMANGSDGANGDRGAAASGDLDGLGSDLRMPVRVDCCNIEAPLPSFPLAAFFPSAESTAAADTNCSPARQGDFGAGASFGWSVRDPAAARPRPPAYALRRGLLRPQTSLTVIAPAAAEAVLQASHGTATGADAAAVAAEAAAAASAGAGASSASASVSALAGWSAPPPAALLARHRGDRALAFLDSLLEPEPVPGSGSGSESGSAALRAPGGSGNGSGGFSSNAVITNIVPHPLAAAAAAARAEEEQEQERQRALAAAAGPPGPAFLQALEAMPAHPLNALPLAASAAPAGAPTAAARTIGPQRSAVGTSHRNADDDDQDFVDVSTRSDGEGVGNAPTHASGARSRGLEAATSTMAGRHDADDEAATATILSGATSAAARGIKGRLGAGAGAGAGVPSAAALARHRQRALQRPGLQKLAALLGGAAAAAAAPARGSAGGLASFAFSSLTSSGNGPQAGMSAQAKVDVGTSAPVPSSSSLLAVMAARRFAAAGAVALNTLPPSQWADSGRRSNTGAGGSRVGAGAGAAGVRAASGGARRTGPDRYHDRHHDHHHDRADRLRAEAAAADDAGRTFTAAAEGVVARSSAPPRQADPGAASGNTAGAGAGAASGAGDGRRRP